MSTKFLNFSLQIKSVDSKGSFQGYASTFGNIDYGFDVVDKGAFVKSIKESKGGKWPILADHNPSDLIGFNVRAEEDNKGLYVDGQLNLDVQKGREKYSLAKQAMDNGSEMGLSIGYFPIKAEPDRKNPIVRRLKELKVFEFSIVTFPMNEQAGLTALKSLGDFDQAAEHLQMLSKQGLSREQIIEALVKSQAAPIEQDPQINLQSIDALISLMKAK